MILNQTYGFTTGQLAAPQANAMAAVIEPLMSGSGAPWALYAIGAILAVVLNFCKIPALALDVYKRQSLSSIPVTCPGANPTTVPS